LESSRLNDNCKEVLGCVENTNLNVRSDCKIQESLLGRVVLSGSCDSFIVWLAAQENSDVSTLILGRAYQPLPNPTMREAAGTSRSPHRIIYAMSNDGGRRVSVSFWRSGSFVWTIAPRSLVCGASEQNIANESYIEAAEKSCDYSASSFGPKLRGTKF
ncbi:hypothetical protein AVEN_70510-1, partial [Araneus ventricosus]